MIGHLHDLDERVIGVRSREQHAVSLELLPIGVVEFVAMSVPFLNLSFIITGPCLGAFAETRWLCAKSHRAALLNDVALIIEQADDGMMGIGVEFGGMSVFEPDNISSVLDDSTLHLSLIHI